MDIRCCQDKKGKVRKVKVGIQFFSVKNRLSREPEQTLRAIAEIGYKYWETCAIKGVPYDPNDMRSFGFGVTAAEAKQLMKELNVKAVGGHFSRNLVNRKNDLLHYLDYQAEAGLEAIGLAYGEKYTDLDSCKRNAEHFNWIGEECKKRGIQFYYHNHNHEFQRMNGKWILDWIMDYCDPELVRLELDTFWVLRSGNSPTDAIDHFGKRILYLHQKDLDKTAADHIILPVDNEHPGGKCSPEDFTEIGTGIMDIQSIIDRGNANGVKYIILEQDHTKNDELASIRMSMESFSRFHGIELT